MPRRKPVAAVSAVAALALAGGLAATFTTSATAPQQKVGSGTMALSIDPVAPTLWTSDISNLAAGDSISRYVDIRNSGTLKMATVTFSQTNTLGTMLGYPSDVAVKMEVCSVAWSVSDGTCAGIRSVALDTASLSLWTQSDPRSLSGFNDFGAGNVRRMKVTTTLAVDAPNEVQGAKGTITYTLNGYQRAPDVVSVARAASTDVSVAQADLSTASWSTTSVPAITRSRYGEGGASDSRGGVYLIGGYLSGAIATTSVERFSEITNSWTQMAPLSVARAYIGTINDPFGNIYAIGGYDGTTVLKSVEKYNPTTNAWTTMASMSTERWSASVASDAQGNIYVMGGRDQSGRFLKSVEKYNPSTDTWTQLPDMPTALRYASSATDLDGNLYVFGGNTTGSIATNQVSKYAVSTGKWSTVASMATARMETQAMMSADGKLYVIGGWNTVSGTATRYASTEVYDPISNTWSAGPSMSTPRISFGATKDSSGRLYVMGGLGATGFTNVVERLG